MLDRMDRIAAIVAVVAIPIIMYGVADAQLPAPKHRAVRSGDVHRTAATSSIGPDPTAPITLFVISDMNELTVNGLPYRHPGHVFVALFVGADRPRGITVRFGANGCLCIERGQEVALRTTPAGTWAIIPIRTDTAPGHPNGKQTFEVARQMGQQDNPIVAVTDIATLPRMTACEGFGDCE